MQLVSLAEARVYSKSAETYKIRHETESTEITDAGLRRLGLEFAVDRRHQRDVEESKVVLADAELELPHRLDERSRLDVSDGTTEL